MWLPVVGVTPRVMVILGTRPEVMKLAPVIRALQDDPDLGVLVCATAQHRDMLDLALDVFGIRPDVDLDLMQPNQQLHGRNRTRPASGREHRARDTPPLCPGAGRHDHRHGSRSGGIL